MLAEPGEQAVRMLRRRPGEGGDERQSDGSQVDLMLTVYGVPASLGLLPDDRSRGQRGDDPERQIDQEEIKRELRPAPL